MAKIFNGSIPIEQIFKFNQNAPLDDRVSVENASDLSSLKTYPGLMVYVTSEDKYYYYNKDSEWVVSTSTGGGDGLVDGTFLGTINGKEFAYKRSINLSSSDIGLDNQKIHVGHSNDGGQTLSNSGEWIGFYIGGNTPSSDPNDYAPWQKLSEGVGIERMDDYFKIGTANSPQKPTVNNQGVVSDDWSPEPLEPTSQYQYLWVVVVTKFTNNTYSVSNPHIAGVKGSSALTGDLDNEMDSIPLNYQGYTTKQETKSTKMTIFFGSTPQTLTQLIATSSQTSGVTLITDKDTGTVVVTIASETLVEENININITGKTAIGEVSKTFTLAAVRASRDGDNAIIYQLQPSDNAIKVNSSLIYSTIYLTVTVNKIDGDVITAVNPNSDGHFLFYKVDDDAWTKYGSQISVGSAQKQVKLRLISVDTINENFTGITYDRETIPVVIDGQNGTSITIKGKVQDSNHLPDPSGYQEGDAIITENDGHIWVIVNGQWVDCGQFQGLPGTSSYVHIKYSIDGTRFTTNNGEDEGPWIGIYVDTNPEDSSNFTDYKWQKISGEDGDSQEFIFIRVDEWDGSENGKPQLTQSSGDDFQRDDYLPSNWTNPESHKVYQWEDDPVEATEDHPFIFYSQRKKISGIWQPFGNVLLWNRFTKDGDTTVLYQLVLSRDVIRPEDESKIINVKIVRSQGEYSENITTEDNFQLKYSIDGGQLLTSTGISNATAGVNINIAAAEDYVNFYLYSDTNLLAQKSCNIITGAIGIQSVVEWYKVTETNTSPSKDDNDWSNTITQVTSELPYLWNYEVCYSTQGGVLSETEITLIAVYSENGRGIAEIQEYYQISSQSTNPPIRWTGDSPTVRVNSDTEKTILNTWKANADLTTHEKPYLWNFAVIQYSKSPFFEYEVPQCIGIQGSSPLIMDLDNEMDSFIVSEDNKYEGENIQLETGVNVYLGKDSQSLTALTATSQSGSGVSSSDIVSDRTSKKVTVTIKKNQIYSKKIEITITATTDSGVLSKVFTIVPVPGGENAVIYKITPAYDVIKVDKNGNRVPASTVTAQITKITGKSNSETANSFDGVTLKYSIDGGSYNNYNPSSPPSSTSIDQNIKFQLIDNNSVVLDQETIPVVYDGSDGSSVLFGDLSNEMDSLVVESNGTLATAKTFNTIGRIFYGTTPVKVTNATILSQTTGVTLETQLQQNNGISCNITIPAGTYNDPINVDITLISGLGNITKTFTIGIAKGGKDAVVYELSPSYDVIKIDKENNYETGSSIKINVNKIVGDVRQSITVTSSNTDLYLHYSRDNSTWTRFYTSSTIDVTNPAITKNLRIRLTNSSSTAENPTNVIYYDRETIPVVQDGSDGDSVLFADLDNEMDCIITDANGVLSTAKVFQINGRMWLGTQQQVITSVTKVGNSVGTVQLTSVDDNDGTGHISIIIPTGTYTDSYQITLNLECSLGSIERSFTVGVAKGGKNAVVYNLLPSVDSIKRTNQGIYQTPSDGKIVVLITKSIGDNISNIQSESGKYIQYSIDDSTTWTNYSSEININSLSPQKNIRLRLIDKNSTAESPSGAIYYDKETIPVVSDGADSTRIVGDLDNEMAGFALDSNGWSSDEVTLSAETTLSVFEGTTPVTITNCTVTNPMSGFCTITKTPLENSTKYKIKIDLAQDDDYNEFLNSPVNFIITGTGEGWSVSRVFSVCFYKSGESAKFYQLQTSSSTIKKTINGEFEEPLTVSAIKVEGRQFNSVTSGVYCYYSLDNSSTWTKLTLSNTTPVNLLDNNNPQYNIRFRLQDVENNSDYGSNGFIQGVKIYDKETIPVIVDGKNAKQYSLVASRKDFNRDDPVTVCSYVSDGEEETPFAGYFVIVEKDFDGEAVNTIKINNQSSKIEDWLPSGDITYKVQFYLFKSRAEVTNFNPDSSIPLAQCELLAQQSTAELDLGGLDGTQNYLVSSENKITETQIFNINCKFYINSIENPCSITVTAKESYTVGMLYDAANSSGTHLQFIANISSTAISGSQIYTIEATATYCGITYTRQKEVIFTPVAAGASIQGANGCIVRYRGNWGDITGYPTVENPARVVLFDCESSHTDAGTFETSPRFKYIDVVRYSGKYYRCNTKHKITLNSQFNANLQTPKYIPGQNYQGQSYWTEANEFDFIVTDTLIAEYVSSQTISAKDVIITERNANNEVTNIVGGMTSSSATVNGSSLNLGSVRIWAGTSGTEPNIQDAPFRVTQGGQLTATNANIKGSISATDFRLVSGNEVVLHLSTFGALKTQFQNTNLSEQNYDDTLPLFAVRDQNDEWYFLPLTKIVPNVPSGSTSVLNEVKGFLLNSSLTANKLVDSSQNSINPTDNVCKLCSSTDTSLNNKYYKLSATSPTTANLYTGDFVGNGLIKKETITINRGGYTADVTIRTRPVLIITNGIAAQRYVYVGPKVTWSSSGYAVDWSTRWFWKPFSTKSDGYHPDFSTEVSATYSEDFLGIYDSITTSNNHNPGPLDV